MPYLTLTENLKLQLV